MSYHGVPETGLLDIGLDLSLTGSFFSAFLVSSALICVFRPSLKTSVLTSPFFTSLSFFMEFFASECCFCADAIASNQQIW